MLITLTRANRMRKAVKTHMKGMNLLILRAMVEESLKCTATRYARVKNRCSSLMITSKLKKKVS